MTQTVDITRRLVKVTPMPGTQALRLEWQDGAVTYKDMRRLIATRRVFAPLAERRRFEKVQLILNGRAVAWSDSHGEEIDLCADALWLETSAALGEEMTPDAFKAWRTRLGLTQQEAAESLGLGKRMIQLYESGHRGAVRETTAKLARVTAEGVTVRKGYPESPD